MLPEEVRAALSRLDAAGHVAYVVGGCVRDFLLGKPAKDHDIVTSASPDEICGLFPDAITVGKAFGVIKVPLRQGPAGATLEIATFREDLEYEDHRHPTAVRFAGPAEDAARRDFTINALFYDPKTSRILDTVGGVEDLKSGIVRAIGEPSERFREDALRLLRAVRFTTRFGFRLEPATEQAVKDRARLITKVSAERIRDEVTLMLLGPGSAVSVRMLRELGLLAHVLPEVDSLARVPDSPVNEPGGATVFAHTLRVLELLERSGSPRSVPLVWAALLHGVGKGMAFDRSGGKNFNGHELFASQIAHRVCERMRLSRDESARVCVIVSELLKFRDVFQMREATLQRFIAQPAFAELLALHRADALASDGNLAFHEFCSARLREMEEARRKGFDARLLKGDDLVQLGLKPGPRFSEILREVEDLALERKLTTKEEALEYVLRNFVR